MTTILQKPMTCSDALRQLANVGDEVLIKFIIDLTDQILKVGQEGGAVTTTYVYGKRTVYIKIYDHSDQLAKLTKMLSNKVLIKGKKTDVEENNEEKSEEDQNQVQDPTNKEGA